MIRARILGDNRMDVRTAVWLALDPSNDDAEDLPADAQRVIGRPVLGRILLDRAPLVLGQGRCRIERNHPPPGLVQLPGTHGGEKLRGTLDNTKIAKGISGESNASVHPTPNP